MVWLFSDFLYRVVQKKLECDLEEKCSRNSKKKLWSLSLYILTSSQEVRAF